MAHLADLTLPECHIHSLDSAACCPHHTQSPSCHRNTSDFASDRHSSNSSVIIFQCYHLQAQRCIDWEAKQAAPRGPSFHGASPGPDLPLSSKTCPFPSRSLATVKGLGLTEQDPLQRGARVHTTGAITNVLKGPSRD